LTSETVIPAFLKS